MVENPITKQKEQLTQADIMTLAMIKQARSGNVGAYRELMDSMFGKIPIVQELTGKDGGPISYADMSDDDLRKELEKLTSVKNKK